MHRLILAAALCPALAAGPCRAQALDKPPPSAVTLDGATLLVSDARRALSYRPAPQADTAGRAQTLAAMLRGLADVPAKAHYRLGFGAYPEFNARMAALAACAPDWDARRGRARGQDTRAWLKARLAAAPADAELATALQSAGWQVAIASLEAVQLCSPARVDWALAPRACAQAPAASARLPCGALVTFELVAP